MRPQRPTAPRAAGSASRNASFRNLSFPPVTGSSLINPGQASCLLNPSSSGSPYCRQFYSGRPSLGFEPVYPGWFPSTGYPSEDGPPPAAEPVQDPQLADQVGNLAAEVEMLRQDQAARDYRGVPPPEPYVQAEEKPPTTLFVYRDGHKMEVQNYAILGKTLWVFTDQRTRQFPLAELDLAATQRANDDRGVEFVAPAQ